MDSKARIEFLRNTLDKINQNVNHLDTQTNILVGISSAVFAVALAQVSIIKIFTPQILVLGLFSAATAIVALFAIHPPRYMRKKGQNESVFHNKGITHYQAYEKYAQRLEEVLQSDTLVLNEYAQEVYNLAKYYYRPKRDLFKLSRNIFLLGILLSLAAFLFL